MRLIVDVENLKSILKLTIALPIKKGIYAITGQNATGKSTLVAAIATAFYNAPMNRYFGKSADNGAVIKFELAGDKKKWEYQYSRWQQYGHLKLKGFYEGSLIYGNRFRDTNIASMDKISRISNKDLIKGDDFVRKNFGFILHNNENYYEQLWTIKEETARKCELWGIPYYYDRNGKRINPYHMSTGENLLVSILHSILIRINDRIDRGIPCLLLLDEIELALHPSSLARLLSFIKGISNEYNLAVYFSTHSIELIREIKPENIFFLERMVDDTINIVTPCYPSYATRILYDHSGYDTVIMVEDDLSKIIIDRMLKQLRLLDNKLVHVLPCGGWTNVLNLADEAIDSNLFSKPSRIIIIIDGDVKPFVNDYVTKKNLRISSEINYLPVKSLEIYLRKNLFEKTDHDLYKYLNAYLFLQTSLGVILEEYKKDANSTQDFNGKLLYKYIENELDLRDKSRTDLIELVVNHLFEKRLENITATEEFLKKNLL